MSMHLRPRTDDKDGTSMTCMPQEVGSHGLLALPRELVAA
jgi:hypothetical protein